MNVHQIKIDLQHALRPMHDSVSKAMAIVVDVVRLQNADQAEAADHLLGQAIDQLGQMRAILAPIWTVELGKPVSMQGRDVVRRGEKARHKNHETAESSPAT